MSTSETGLPVPSDATRKHVVLFVDDDPKILACLQRLLANEPYELLTTESQAQAHRWVQERAVSLLIADQVQPSQLGTELLEQVRTRSPATRVAILTAYPEGETLLRMRRASALRVIEKPWDDEELKRTIQGLLQDPCDIGILPGQQVLPRSG